MFRKMLVAMLVAPVALLAGTAAAQVGSVTVEVKGMSCPFCAFGVEKKLGAVEGVNTVIVSMKGGSAELTAREGASIDIASVPEAVRRAGFTPGRMEATIRGTVRETDGGFELAPSGGGRPLPLEPAGASMSPAVSRAARNGGLWEVTGEIDARGKNALRLRATAFGPAS